MQDVLTFWRDFLGIVADFLMAEPVVFFVAIIILILLIGVLQRVLYISK